MLTVSKECIRCGRCARVCPTGRVVMGREAPESAEGASCIQCGHCEAICPAGALETSGVSHEDILSIDHSPVLDAPAAELFLRSRRSVRLFRREAVNMELTRRLLDIGRYAPTACNSQGVEYLVASPETMEGVRRLTAAYFRDSRDPVDRSIYQMCAQSEQDYLFRGAPMLLLALTRGEGMRENARFAFTYVELYAPSLGLGTCWAGFFERYAASNCAQLRSHLDLPGDRVIAAALLYGYPKYAFHRTVGRDPLQIHWR